MEENFSMEWNMKWKIFSMDWKCNGRKLPVWNMEKSSSIPYHALVTKTTRKCRTRTGAPRAEREPGDSSNMGPLGFVMSKTDGENPKKKVFTEISTVFPAEIK